MAWFAKHGIALPPAQKVGAKLGGNPFKMSASFSRQHCVDSTSMKYFDRYEHPFSRTILDIYVEKKRTAPFWYYVWGGAGLAGIKSIVSSTAKARIRHAIRDALASRGYDRDGRRLPLTAPKPGEDATAADAAIAAVTPAPQADLVGTLKVQTVDPKKVCNAKYVDVLADVDKIVGLAEIQLRHGGGGGGGGDYPKTAGRGFGGGGGGGGAGVGRSSGGGGGRYDASRDKRQRVAERGEAKRQAKFSRFLDDVETMVSDAPPEAGSPRDGGGGGGGKTAARPESRMRPPPRQGGTATAGYGPPPGDARKPGNQQNARYPPARKIDFGGNRSQ